MSTYEIRDTDAARQHVLQGLLLSRSAPITPKSVSRALAWSMEVVSDGSPLPTVGFVADVGFVALGTTRSSDLTRLENVEGLDHTITRRYEDYVLGKLYADISFDRAGDALLRYSGRDQDRGVAYIINQQRVRCGFGGAVLAPGVIKGLQQLPPDEVVLQAWRSLEDDGLSPTLQADFESLIAAVRNTGELLGAEDIFELESGTALAEFGQRIALRQVLQMATRLGSDLPKQKPRSQPRRYSVATNIMEEDHYPIGGFTSLSNKGTVESMVRSELAYIEDDMRPDLFDIKFARNELLYYSRDENQFLRRRLTFIFALYPSLKQARFKDDTLPCQRIIMMLAGLYVLTGQLIEWLSSDAIRFEFLFVEPDSSPVLDDERTLLETLFREEIASGTVALESIDPADLESRCTARARTSLCHSLSIGCDTMPQSDDLSIASQLLLERPEPTLLLADESVVEPDETGLDGWKEQLDTLLRFWV